MEFERFKYYKYFEDYLNICFKSLRNWYHRVWCLHFLKIQCKRKIKDILEKKSKFSHWCFTIPFFAFALITKRETERCKRENSKIDLCVNKRQHQMHSVICKTWFPSSTLLRINDNTIIAVQKLYVMQHFLHDVHLPSVFYNWTVQRKKVSSLTHSRLICKYCKTATNLSQRELFPVVAAASFHSVKLHVWHIPSWSSELQTPLSAN